MDSERPAPEGGQNERWIAVGRLLRPQGRRGEILCEPLTDLPDVFAKGRQVRLVTSEETAAHAPVTTLEDCWRPQGRNAGRLVLKLAGVDSISAAEAIEARGVYLLESELPALAPDTFLVRDLVGCTLYDGEQRLGVVTDLQFPVASDGRTRLPDAMDLLVLQPEALPEDAEPILIPFVKAWLSAVDLPGKRIVMQLPSGLLE